MVCLLPRFTTLLANFCQGGRNDQNLSLAGGEANLDVQFAFGLSHPIPVASFYSQILCSYSPTPRQHSGRLEVAHLSNRMRLQPMIPTSQLFVLTYLPSP